MIFRLITYAQDIRINELVSYNRSYTDADGDYSDWFELYNYGSTSVSLHNWSVSDDEDDLTKWVFPDISLDPNEYMLLWASSKDRAYLTFPRTLVSQGDVFKYHIPSSEPPSDWKTIDFDDASWLEGASGIGYGDDDDSTLIPEGTNSVYTRIKFNMTNLEDLLYLIFDIDYDDGFVAYINDFEIARSNLEGEPPMFDARAYAEREAEMYIGGKPERYYQVNTEDYIVEGENVLCIQLHNHDPSSSDLTLIPFLSAVLINPTDLGIIPPDILSLPNRKFHTNFKISSEGEPLILSNDQNQIIDQLPETEIPTDFSIGRSGNESEIFYFINPTPGYQNDETAYLGIISNEVVFSHPGGFLEEPVNLTLAGQSNDQIIRYTTDATPPNETSLVYSSPIAVTDNTVIRASIFEPDYIPSTAQNRTFIFNQNHEIDVVFLTTDPYNLFDEEYGIYVPGPEGTYDPHIPYYGANFWEDWERPVHMAFYEKETANLGTEFNAGIKIYGNWSRGQYEQRSLALYARRSYGDPKFEYPFFDDLSYNEFENLVLRNSGQDFLISSIKDITLTSLMEGSGLEYQSYRPVATYINGDYWGMYHLREKINEHMLASKFNIDADEITLLTANADEIEGSNEEYLALLDYITNTDLSNDHNFEYVKEQMDIHNYALYQATEIYISNYDWPGSNIKYWKHPGAKWRWILYDTDQGFGPRFDTDNYDTNALSLALEDDGPSWPNPPWSTLLFRRLVTNISFRNTFINRSADELNSRFLPEPVKAHIDQISQSILSEVEAHYTRWDGDPSDQAYYVNEMKNWAENRPAFAKEHIMAQFQLPAMHSITIHNENVEEGFVRVNNNLKIQTEEWPGDYFETVPIQLKAVPELGYEFSHWTGASHSMEAIINLSLENDTTVTPHFIPAANLSALVINEINYKSAPDFDPDDWIELYNPNTFSVDISNWILKDNNNANSYYLPEGTSMSPMGYLVICRNQIAFHAAFPLLSNYIGDLSFGLSGDGDAVRLFNNDGVLQDEVHYEAVEPWPICPAGNGPTLELIGPELDNNLAESWKCINNHGSPGAANTEAYAIEEISTPAFKTYPNPVNNILYITGIENSALVKLYSPSGQVLISDFSNGQLDVSMLSPGVYILDILEGRKMSKHKLIKN